MKTDRFIATFGITPGYGHSNEREMTLSEFAEIWNESCEASMASGGYYVSAVISSSVVVYPTNRGCPSGGENVFTVWGVRNPTYCRRGLKWRSSVREAVRITRQRLMQSTTQVAFDRVKMMYVGS